MKLSNKRVLCPFLFPKTHSYLRHKKRGIFQYIFKQYNDEILKWDAVMIAQQNTMISYTKGLATGKPKIKTLPKLIVHVNMNIGSKSKY